MATLPFPLGDFGEPRDGPMSSILITMLAFCATILRRIFRLRYALHHERSTPLLAPHALAAFRIR